MIAREWKKSDIAQIAEIEKQCFSDPWSEQAFESSMNTPFFYGFLFEEGGQVCAYACEMVIFEDAEILNIAVAPSFRRRGLGKELMLALENYAKNKGAERLLLEVREGNLAARGLYEKQGFLAFGVRKNYYEDGENAIVMQKTI